MDVPTLTALIVAVFGGAGVTGLVNAVSAWRSGVKKDEREAAADLARELDTVEAERDKAVRERNLWREVTYLTRVAAIEHGTPVSALPPVPE
ncbi:hypothetical protein [Rhodococcus sp. 06-156-3C]|uniref:hypothetical protein n=1 Tax=Rhodococcus sp. 06-156-3C TaxID=2022486 RepID=UPI00113FF39B|nr:hypothetical protein [Rhodococcus sp. 06-156-3C]